MKPFFGNGFWKVEEKIGFIHDDFYFLIPDGDSSLFRAIRTSKTQYLLFWCHSNKIGHNESHFFTVNKINSLLKDGTYVKTTNVKDNDPLKTITFKQALEFQKEIDKKYKHNAAIEVNYNA